MKSLFFGLAFCGGLMACHDPATIPPATCLSDCDAASNNQNDAIPINNAGGSGGQAGNAGTGGTGGTGAAAAGGSGGSGGAGGMGGGQPADCSTIVGVNQCRAAEGCWFAATGCADPEGGPPALPQEIEGCQPQTLLCPDGQCPNGLACRIFITNPCVGQPCQACGEQTAVCIDPTVLPSPCGMPGPDGAAVRCEAGFYCEFPDGAECGDALEGICQPQPRECPEDCPRVCGCDGQTYCNACEAASRGMSVRHSGFCPTPQAPAGTCIQKTHPAVRVVAEGAECAEIDFQCDAGQRMYGDSCSCGCIDNDAAVFACNDDSDCVPEGCCRPTGCVTEAASACAHDEEELCCFCADCRPAVAACSCIGGVCHTRFDQNACE